MQNPASNSAAMADINMTPMIDVLLVLIIIFMVMTPTTPIGLPAAIPQPAGATSIEPTAPVVISVFQGGSLELNHQPLTIAELPSRLREILRNRAEPVVFVSGEADLEFREVAQVIDLARGAGVARVALMSATR